MELIKNTCVCGESPVFKRLFLSRDYNFGSTLEAAWITRCSHCNSLFPELVPSSDTIHEAYANYYTRPRARSGFRRLLRALLDRTRRIHLRREVPFLHSDVLDYGCGSGEFLRTLARDGHKGKLTGTDIRKPGDLTEAEAYEWIEMQDISSGGRTYDWITLSHVIEHLQDPVYVIKRLYACCRSDGGLWISTPNADSILVNIFREHARDVDFPRHRLIFSRTGLERMLADAGFQVEFLPSPRVDALMNFSACASNLQRDRSVSALRKAAVLLGGFLQLVLHLLKPWSLRALDGPEVVVVARPIPVQ